MEYILLLLCLLVGFVHVSSDNIFNGTQYIGCFKDNQSRAFNFRHGRNDKLTNQKCISECKRRNYTYSGTQYRYECFCGESYDKHGPEPLCELKCEGDGTQTCGGAYKNSVYSVCPFRYFGENCTKNCPTNCNGTPNVVCQVTSGHCMSGCTTSYGGKYCDCKALKGDRRSDVQDMNNKGGTHLNLFTTLQFDTQAAVKGVRYYSLRNGSVYISFWRKVTPQNNQWQLVNKIELNSDSQVGIKEYFLKDNVINLNAGDAVAVHYKKGVLHAVIPSGKSSANTPGLHEVISGNIQDDGWKPGKTISHSPNGTKMTPAIQVLYNCVTECLAGTYGPNCSANCPSNCYNKCHRYTGVCLEGCKAGYEGETCNSACVENKYGRNCQETCGHCKNNETCNFQNGSCPIGCGSGFKGPICKTKCARGKYGENCQGICSSNCNNSCDKYGNCTDGCKPGWKDKQCNTPCENGKYGSGCGKKCSGNCKDKTFCNKTTGICEAGCLAGYNRTADQKCFKECGDNQYGFDCQTCSPNCKKGCTKKTIYGDCNSGECNLGYKGLNCTTPCPVGEYGPNCVMNCSSNCFKGCESTSVHGDCISGCTFGYKGHNCTQPCANGTYGKNCLKNCSGNCKNNEFCENKNGTCPSGCVNEWYGEKCDSRCPLGKYGENCSLNCGHCAGGKTCRYKTGHCPNNECEPGYTTDLCQTECTDKTYGYKCLEQCHCKDNTACHHVTGFCEVSCDSGWIGENCSIIDLKMSGSSLNGAAIGGMVFIVIAIIAVTVVAVVFLVFKKQRSKHPYSNNNNNEEPQISFKNGTGNLEYENSNEIVSIATNIQKNTKPVNPVKPVIPEVKPVIPEKPVKPVKSVKPLEIYQNVNPSESNSTLISVSNLGQYISNMMKMKQPFAEYYELPNDRTDSWDYCAQQKLKIKNRFKNIMPYDKNRVVLSVINEDPLTDYINASFIEDYSGKRAFIASHGPTNVTLEDFWRMIWEYEVGVIVMVTNLFEGAKMKCHQYWPDKETQKHDGFTITTGPVESYSDYELRHFSLKSEKEVRKLKQFHYTGWPDHGVPPTAAGLWAIREKVKAYKTKNRSPVVVHCSAGVGRTGTFIALDILLDQVGEEEKVDVHSCVRNLRTQRKNMVQTLDQYIFLYNALREVTLLGETSINCATFDNALIDLQKHQDNEKSIMEQQFEFLETIKPKFKEEDVEMALCAENQTKNYDKNIVPAEKHRIILPSAPNNYINAVHVAGYRNKKKYIATQIPTDSENADIWKMIIDYKCNTVVLLGDEPEGNKDGILPLAIGSGRYYRVEFQYRLCEWLPNANETVECESLIVSNTKQTVKIGVKQDLLTILEQPNKDITVYANVGDTTEAEVRVFSTSKCKGKHLKDSSLDIIPDIYSEVQKYCKDKSIIVMCRNGASDTGIYIAATYLFDMANSEQLVDFFSIVKYIRRTRPQFVNSLEEYNFLHIVVKEYLKAFENYANMK